MKRILVYSAEVTNVLSEIKTAIEEAQRLGATTATYEMVPPPGKPRFAFYKPITGVKCLVSFSYNDGSNIGDYEEGEYYPMELIETLPYATVKSKFEI